MKRKLILVLSFLALCISMTAGVVFASNSNNVSQDEAEQAALNHIEKKAAMMPGWDGATVSRPVSYYAPDGAICAYEFTVEDGVEEVGFIIVSARKDWMPVLEYGTGKAPSACLPYAKQMAIDEAYISSDDNSEPRIYYWGACTYSMQLGDKMKNTDVLIHLTTGTIRNLPKESPQLQMDSTKSRNAWAEISESVNENSVIKKITSWFVPSKAYAAVALSKWDRTTTISYTSDYISGVPAFYQGTWWGGHGDDHDPDADTWPSCSGYPDDLWDDWDGCAPIAGAMVLGYWSNQGYSEIPDPDDGETEDILIDNLHVAMGTSDEGATTNIYVTGAMECLTDIFYGYNFSTLFTTATWSLVTSNITADRPFVLCMQDYPEEGVGHAVCVYGYEDDGEDSIRVFNTWNTSTNFYITWGDWSAATMHDVHP